ncbi:MAG: hypothetical protein JJE28_06870 [Actinomycetales bacterium]|nr:hypothetical protein [Actinomycetales bacterium]
MRTTHGFGSRNFNVILVETPQIPELAHLQVLEPRTHVYGTVAILAFLLARTHPGNAWRDKTIEFIEDGTKAISEDLATVGFTTNWKNEQLWSPDYQRDATRAERVRVLSSFITKTTAEAAEMLHAMEPKNRKKSLRYLRTNHALLGLKISETYQYPDFQFDIETGEVPAIIVEANRRLFMSLADDADDEISWASAAWWLAPSEECGGLSPLQAFGQNLLTQDVLDRLLTGPAE